MNVATVILAAGQGTRMRSKLPKVLHPLGGQPMVMYMVNLALQVSSQPAVMVVGHGARLVRDRVGEDCVRYVLQEQRLGTGHAVLQARDELQGRSEAVLVLYGDMPLLTPPTVSGLLSTFASTLATVTMLTLQIAPGADSMGFGRIVRDAQGRVTGIIEEVSATSEQLQIRELNCGVYCFRADWLWDHLTKLQASGKGEYYLTDLIGVAAAEGQRVEALPVSDPDEVLGINDRIYLSRAEAILRRRINVELMRGGVTLIDPETTYAEVGVRVAPDTVIYPNTYLQGDVSIGDDCIIGPNCLLRNSAIGPSCRITGAVIEDAVLGTGVTVGPYAHIRSGTHLEDNVHMGNFAEVKNSYLGRNTRMDHFSYVGDAMVGANVNIGAGAVTCDEDGERNTEIGEGALIGGGAMLVAPIRIGPGAQIGAGAVVTHDVEANALVYGVPARPKGTARPEQIEIPPEDAASEEQRVIQEESKWIQPR